MLRRCAGDCYSQSRAICLHLGHIVQFARVPHERLPARGVSAEFFPQFHGIVQTTNLLLAIPPPRKNPDAAPCGLSRKTACHQFAAGSPQRCRKALKLARMTCKYLSLIEISSKSLASCLAFALAFPSFSHMRISEIAQSTGMQLKRFSCNAIFSAACEAAAAKFELQ
jgi:hypothetical protein